jgi:hypothetical protein
MSYLDWSGDEMQAAAKLGARSDDAGGPHPRYLDIAARSTNSVP